MKRVLLIKWTSMGDVIHTLPALTDALQARPDIQFDWMVDEAFSEIPQWHFGVHQIFKTSHRTWKKKIFSSLKPIFSLLKEMRKTPYDLIIDAQGNFKTALASLLLRGPASGFDKNSVREPIASLAYQTSYPIAKQAHAIDRLRNLFSSSLGYPKPSNPPDFGLNPSLFKPHSLPLHRPYIVFVHHAAWKTKLWPEEYCRKLIDILLAEGYEVLLSWGNLDEKARALRISQNLPATVLPKMPLSEMASVMIGAVACVSMDTGLSHLAAALKIPSIALYGPTNPNLIGIDGPRQISLQGQLPCIPCYGKSCKLRKTSNLNPPCLETLTPEAVLQKLHYLLHSEKPVSNIYNR